jgi:hypothetical protein
MEGFEFPPTEPAVREFEFPPSGSPSAPRLMAGRGGAILAIGVAALGMAPVSLFLALLTPLWVDIAEVICLGLVPFALGLLAAIGGLVMARSDLKWMALGRMDRSARRVTRAGKWLCVIALCLYALSIILIIAGLAAPPPLFH